MSLLGDPFNIGYRAIVPQYFLGNRTKNAASGTTAPTRRRRALLHHMPRCPGGATGPAGSRSLSPRFETPGFSGNPVSGPVRGKFPEYAIGSRFSPSGPQAAVSTTYGVV